MKPRRLVGTPSLSETMAGATWWSEGFDWNYSLDQVRMRIRLGPPTTI